MSGDEYLDFLDEYWDLFEDARPREVIVITDARL
jgi:hypothetical protein